MPWLKNTNNFLLVWRFLLPLCFLAFWSADTAYSQTSSVLASGTWYKIGVTSTGVYKMDPGYFRQMGIDLSGLDPRQIALYGNGAGILPQPNNLPRPEDLQQVALKFDIGSGGKPESVYFFGEGPTIVRYDSLSGKFTHEINPYTDTTYYFLTVRNSPGLEISADDTPLPADPTLVYSFDQYWFYEKEATNLLKSGRAWWGDFLGTTPSLNIEVPVTGMLPNEMGTLTFGAIASAQVPTKFIWQIDGKTAGEQTADIVSTYRYDQKAQPVQATFHFTTPAEPRERLRLNLTYDKNGQTSASAYLDFVSLQYKRRLTAYGEPVLFQFSPLNTSQSVLSFSDLPEEYLLWDISQPLRPVELRPVKQGNTSEWWVPVDLSTPTTLIGFRKSQTITPHRGRRVSNQNIRSSATPNLLIITPDIWQEEAQRLADFRRKNDSLDVLVVTIEQVYNEFSSGKPDVSAIRDFSKLLYEQEPGKLKYLLLFGDATYDYRNKRGLDNELQMPTRIPTYQSRESLHPVYTFASDDYFGFLNSDSGEWNETPQGDHLLQIGVGRLPVKTKEEAQIVVNKLIDYATASVRGPWKNKAVFIADNGDDNIHQQHADQLARQIGGQFLTSRLFVDEFALTETSLGQRAPELNQEIRRRINDGTLILNFTGHGDETGWTNEQILTLADMQAMKGYGNLPLLVTATCEFGRYDDPTVVSGAELLTLSPRGAAIGAMTTTRPVFSSTNFSINSAFYAALLAGYTRLGDIIRVTKNTSLAGALNRNFVLMGDPSMRLALPELLVAPDAPVDTIHPLTETVIKGKIMVPETNQLAADFNGFAHVSVYDKQDSFTTRGAQTRPETYKEYRTKLFEGKVSVKSGRFEVKFIPPFYSRSSSEPGLVSFYAYTSDLQSDASGQLTVSIGAPGDAVSDNTAPAITAYINSPDFSEGQSVGPLPVLHVTLSDDTGLRITPSHGDCGIRVLLNDKTELPASEYFSYEPDSYQNATITLPLNLMEEGDYRLSIRACDLAGNETEKTLRFKIREEETIRINSSVVYPNPFRSKIFFRVTHNRAGDDIEANVAIYTRTGRKIFESQDIIYNSGEQINYTIDPLNFPENIKAEPEIYLYRLTLRSLRDNTNSIQSGVILHH